VLTATARISIISHEVRILESERYFKGQAERLLKLVFLPRKKPVNRKTAGLMRGEKAVMLYLYDHEDGVTAGELSKALEIGSGGIANLLNALEKKELIIRTMSHEDRRKIIVTLDPKGREDITAHRREVLESTEEMLRRLGKEDTSELIRILSRMTEIGNEICLEQEGDKNAETP
jgi:DNA-binding MarR family transcriptional regulator